jgi:Uma2 family endonuclease
MAIVSEHRLWTFEDFCERIPEGLKADLIEGVIYVASPDNIEHYGINSWLNSLWSLFLEKRKIRGRLFGFKMAFRLSEKSGPEPDLAYVRPENAYRIRKTSVQGAPDAAMEIVSPDSIDRDYRKKRKLYQKHGVAEYWIIDPLVQRVRCYRLGKDGKYKAVAPRNGRIESHIVPGFWIKPAWLWQSPLPPVMETLQEILDYQND